MLEDLGVDLVEAASGEEALRHVAKSQYAVVLLDVQMPGLDGFEVARRIRARPESQHTPIIFETAYDPDVQILETAYGLGAVDFLVKPFRPVVLRAKVVGFVEIFKQQQRLQQHADELATSEERFRLLVEGTREYAIFMLNPGGQIVSWNPGAERIKQYQASEIVGQHFSRFYPPEEIQAGKPERALQIAQAEGSYSHEGWRVRKDGTRFWASVVLTALRDKEGRLRGFGKVTRDVTERMRAEETGRRLLQEETARRTAEDNAREVEQQREQLRVTLTSIGDAVITTDAEGRVNLLNPVAERLTGWNSSEAEGMPLENVFSIINELTRERVEHPVAKVISRGVIVGLANHTVLIARDGTEHPIDDSAAPIMDAQGRVTGCVLIFRDITDRRRLERESAGRLATARLLAAIVESSDDAIVSKSLDGVIQSWNAGARRIFGFPAEEAVGKHISLIIPPERIGEEDEIIRNLAAGRRVDHFETERLHRDGHRISVSLTISPIKDEKGRVIGASKIARDITQRKQSEQALREADRRKDEFLATLAHELRNPLAPIRNALELAHRSAVGIPELEHAHGLMTRQLARLVRLVDDLLDISRITSGKIQLRPERVNLAAIVQSAVEGSRAAIDAQAQELTVILPEKPIFLQADPVRLAQVLSNLLNNAVKYTESGGHIWLTVEQQDHEAVISVRDTGIGIEPDQLPRVFEMFSQATPALERSQGGLGIGLALVKGLVGLHGGSVEAHSKGSGLGSEFIVRLPISEPSTREQPPGEVASRPSAGPKHRILVVDDNRDAADSMAMMLRAMGHETHAAYDGVEAIQSTATFHPNVVLMDIGMPRMNGYDAARHIRSQMVAACPALIALTGWGQEEDKRRALEAGFDHHLTKPVEPMALDRLLGIITRAPPN